MAIPLGGTLWQHLLQEGSSFCKIGHMSLWNKAEPPIGFREAVHMDDTKAEGGGAGAIPAIGLHKGDFAGLSPEGRAGQSVNLGAGLIDANGIGRENIVEKGAELSACHRRGKH